MLLITLGLLGGLSYVLTRAQARGPVSPLL